MFFSPSSLYLNKRRASCGDYTLFGRRASCILLPTLLGREVLPSPERDCERAGVLQVPSPERDCERASVLLDGRLRRPRVCQSTTALDYVMDFVF